MREDESYQLVCEATGAVLTAASSFGIRRGLETFLQLIRDEPQHGGFCVPAVSVADSPRFPWRGVLIDCARRFLSVGLLKRQLDGLAAAKLNVFHWHLTDDQGWRFESRSFPELTARGSDGKFYTQAQMREVVAYATALGIRVVPEIDLPGHASALAAAYPELISMPPPAQQVPPPVITEGRSRANSWLIEDTGRSRKTSRPLGGPDHPSYEIERRWGVFEPLLDPSNPKVWDFIDRLTREVVEVFPDEYIHIGGDEVNVAQWKASSSVQDYIEDHKLVDEKALHAHFNRRVGEIFARHGRRVVGWDETYHPDLPRSTVIQSWQGQDSLGEAAADGFDGVLSTGFYIDQPHATSFHYRNDPAPPAPVAIDDVLRPGEHWQTWAFQAPRRKGAAVTGTFTIIRQPKAPAEASAEARGFIDFGVLIDRLESDGQTHGGRSRRPVSDIQMGYDEAGRPSSVQFWVDSWMGQTTPMVNLDAANRTLEGDLVVGNAIYVMTGRQIGGSDMPGTALHSNRHPVSFADPSVNSRILGGEIALWAENVKEETLEQRMWPRAFAIAERLWSPATLTDIASMYARLDALDTFAMVSIGLLHHAHELVGLTRLAGGRPDSLRSLQVFATAVEQAQYYHRHHEKATHENYDQFDPLNRLADVLPPESAAIRALGAAVDTLLREPASAASAAAKQAREEIEGLLHGWADAVPPMRNLCARSSSLAAVRPVVDSVEQICALGLQLAQEFGAQGSSCLDKRAVDNGRRVIAAAKQMQDELVVSSAYPIERLLNAVAQKV